MAYQKIIIRGNLGQAPETRHLQSGSSVTEFSVAVGEKWKDNSGQQQEHTEWFRCTAWGATGENIAKYFQKGSGILVEGKMRTEKYQHKDTGQDMYSVKLMVSQFDFIDSKGTQQAPQQQAQPQAGGRSDFDDDIGF